MGREGGGGGVKAQHRLGTGLDRGEEGTYYKINTRDQETVYVPMWGHMIDHTQHQCGNHTPKYTKQNAANACAAVYATLQME